MWIGNMSKKSNKDKKEFNPYAIDRFATISPKLKIGFLKFWIVGASFFLSIFGLPQKYDFLDRMVVFWLLLVLMFEYIGFTIINWMHNDEVNTKKYLPHEINRKSILSILATGLYIFIMLILVHYFVDTWVYYGIPTFGTIMSETSIDPITYALVFLLFDFIWLKVRNTIKNARME